LYKAKNALLPVSLLGLAVALGFQVFDWGKEAEPLFHGMVIFDHFALAFSALCIVLTGLTLLLSKEYFTAISKNIAEYYSLLLFSLVGAVIVNSYHNFVMLFMGVEIMSVALYILAGIRKTDLYSNEASMKYFIMGAFSTGFLLFGITLLYGATGTFDLTGVREYVIDNPQHISPLFYGGILLLLIGLCFKIGAAPFHFWTPDVYDGAPTLVTIFMSTVVKVASFAAFLRLFDYVFAALNDFWTPVLLVVIIITLFLGNISALMQTSYKRMLAYSSISHAGYMLFGILTLGPNSTSGIFVYALAYSLATIIGFGSLILIKRVKGSDQFIAFNGLAKNNPLLAVIVTLAMLSLAGIPLTGGFIGKFMMFSNVMGDYHVVLLVMAAINAAIGVFYYLRVVVHMYFKEADSETDSVVVPGVFQTVFILAAVLILMVGIYPDCLIGLF
jgi:NADH-quinone oxidoreductase subunit N